MKKYLLCECLLFIEFSEGKNEIKKTIAKERGERERKN